MDIKEIIKDKEIAECEIKAALIKFVKKHNHYLNDVDMKINWVSLEIDNFYDLKVDIDTSIKI